MGASLSERINLTRARVVRFRVATHTTESRSKADGPARSGGGSDFRSLVEVVGDRAFGYWGPISNDVAEHLKKMISRLSRRSEASPEEWSLRLASTTRHAHTGLGAVACGAFELACWDLLGHKHGVPIWQLFSERPRTATVGSYATCFGHQFTDPQATEKIVEVAGTWPIQKWRPPSAMDPRARRALEAARSLPPGSIALDFGGRWTWNAALQMTDQLGLTLAWMEEPFRPHELGSFDVRVAKTPVAAGEHCYNLVETAILSNARIKIWQPDAVFCGGLSVYQAIGWVAKANDCSLYPHGGGLLPAVHAAFAGLPCELIEFHLNLEPERQAHLEKPLLPGIDGTFPLPTHNGWAGRLSRSTLLES